MVAEREGGRLRCLQQLVCEGRWEGACVVKSCVGDGGERGTRAADWKCFVQGHPPGHPSCPSLCLTCWLGAGGNTQRLPSRSPWGAGRQSADWWLQPCPVVQPRRLRAGTHRMWEPQGPGGACHAAEAGRPLCSSLHHSGSWARAETASSVGISGSLQVGTAPQLPSPIAHPPLKGWPVAGRAGPQAASTCCSDKFGVLSWLFWGVRVFWVGISHGGSHCGPFRPPGVEVHQQALPSLATA